MSNSIKETIRLDCPMRHENGNCLVAGGFCTAVNTPICEALHNAYNAGKFQTMEEMKKQGYRKQSENVIELPCKVGTTVYVIEPLWFGVWGEDDHKCRKCEHFYEGGMGDTPDCCLGNNCCYQISEKEADLRKLADWITPSVFTGKIAWGKTVFLTKEEAEAAALAERSNDGKN